MSNAFSLSKAASVVDESTIEQQAVERIIMQYIVGERKTAKASPTSVEGGGGFFVAIGNVPVAVQDEFTAKLRELGWTDQSITTQSGEEIEGLGTQSVRVAILADRLRWVAEDETGSERYFPNSRGVFEKVLAETGEYPRSHMQVMLVIEGAEEFGPVILTARGLTCKALNGTRKAPGAFQRHYATTMAAAHKLVGKAGVFPRYAFWLTLEAAKDTDGKPLFTEVGKDKRTSFVVFPVAADVPNDINAVTEEDLAHWFIGYPNLETHFPGFIHENEGWKEAWDSFDEDDADVTATVYGAKAGDVADTDVNYYAGDDNDVDYE